MDGIHKKRGWQVRIAFFDSGIGGLTVLRQAVSVLPDAAYVYYADTRHAPYGVKPKGEVRRYIFEAADFLAGLDIQALVVACNTATAVAINDLRARYRFPIVGMEPAVKPALTGDGGGRKVLVAATSLTLRESKLGDLIAKLDRSRRVERLELDGLVPFAERFEFDTPEVRRYLQTRLAGVDWPRYATAVLGCTHFLFYKPLIQSIAGEGVRLIDGNAGTVRQLVRVLGGARAAVSGASGEVAFYSSGVKDPSERVRRLEALLKTPLA